MGCIWLQRGGICSILQKTLHMVLLVGHRVAYGLIWDICGGAFGCRWVAFGCTGVAYAAYDNIRCIWLLACWPQGAHRSERIHPVEGKMELQGS